MSKEWSGNKSSTFTTIGATGHGTYKREQGDFYATDPKALLALHYAYKLPKSKHIWECACGNGGLSETLKTYGYDVISTDLYNRGYGETGIDFLQTKELLAPCILTNPPYSLATDFVLHALNLGAEELYMFVKLQFLEGKRRYREIYSKTPPAEILQFVERMRVAKNGDYETYKESSAMAFCWLVWKRGFAGNPQLSWISAESVI